MAGLAPPSFLTSTLTVFGEIFFARDEAELRCGDECEDVPDAPAPRTVAGHAGREVAVDFESNRAALAGTGVGGHRVI